ncbi:MAG TPA: peptide-methionine (S)-S-oxide reductase MsrA [Rhizomicrobium sp.]|nr:peptide-methionine (S)-S-oxide reductase MsrA [Rhizomicrobium sp.]
MNKLHLMLGRLGFAALGVAALGAVLIASANADEAARAVPMPAVDTRMPGNGLETAVLAGGCFWGVEGVFQHVKGVKQVLAGYSGGSKATASYPLVGTELTGHAESVEIKFDPRVITYGQILRVFFSVAHDPTQMNRQGPDSGPSYRSNIFAANAEQAKIARAYVEQLDKAHVYSKPIATRVDPLKAFYPAESYHQDFLLRHPDNGYIVVNDLPKIANLKRLLPEYYREQPVSGAKPS